MANVLGIPSPKEDIDSIMVRDVYYEEGDLDRIVAYCELDVITLVQIFLRLRNEPLMENENIKKFWNNRSFNDVQLLLVKNIRIINTIFFFPYVIS